MVWETIITWVSVGAVVIVSVNAAIKQRKAQPVKWGLLRFRKAAILIGAGVVFGAFDPPDSWLALELFVASLALSIAVGLLRGIWSEVWLDTDGQTVLNRGTSPTIALFLGLILVKCALSVYGQYQEINDEGALGEILFMIGTMAACYAEVVNRRAKALAPASAYQV